MRMPRKPTNGDAFEPYSPAAALVCSSLALFPAQ
jgi:hypothetical protein